MKPYGDGDRIYNGANDDASGVAAVIDPTGVDQSVLSLHVFVMVAFTLVLFAMTYDYDGKSELSRVEGISLFAAFVAYQAYVVQGAF